MMKGRKPKPARLKELSGDPRYKGASSSEPVMADLRESEPPEYLDGYGRGEWRRILATTPEGLVTAADVSVLAALCASFGRWRKAHDALQKGDDVVLTPSGYVRPSAWVQIERDARRDYLAAAAEFGLTPSSRTRVSVSPRTDPAVDCVKSRFFRHEEAD